jgi:class 3 adenylate cyclase
MTEAGWHTSPGGVFSLGILAIYDPRGAYSCGAAKISSADPRKSGAEAADRATKAAQKALSGDKRPFKPLKGIWLMTEPGLEEKLTQGVVEVCGSGIPLGGGSSGNNSGTAKGVQLCNGQCHTGSIVVALLYSWLDVLATFENGFKATGQKGIVTKAEGRTVLKIDDRPAIDVYNEWTNSLVGAEAKARDGVILGKVTLYPLGRVTTFTDSGEAMYVTIVPVAVTKEGGFTTLNEVFVGDELSLMANNKSTVIAKMKANYKKTVSTFEDDALLGALISLCVCHVLTMESDFPTISEELNDALGKPYLLANTFGEQGSFRKGMTAHGNLMVASLLFSRPREVTIDRVASSLSLSDAAASAVAPTGEVAIAFVRTPLVGDIAKFSDDVAKQIEDIVTKALRKTSQLCSGYEVKAIDGELMVAFPTAVDAVKWSTSCIAAMASLPWPTKINMFFKAKGVTPSVGLRFGLVIGRVDYRFNSGTRKIDYFGPLVNTCARLSQYSGPEATTSDQSLILATQEIVNATALARSTGNLQAVFKPLGQKTLKGLDKPLEVFGVSTE